jgi:mRNA deadenylase 3'-5' endonuclease subunit Ccr4
MPLLNQLVERQGLPCLGNPSDHLPLLARFQFKDESQQSSV